MLGAYAVGKTSLVKRFVESMFDESYHTTIGVQIDKKRTEVEGRPMTLIIWDLAGEDEVEQIRLSHLRGASGYVLVADGCRRSTLERTVALRRCVDETIGRIPFVLAVNKADLRQDWDVDLTVAQQLAIDDSTVFHTSAKTGDRVEEMFQALATKMLSTH